MPDRLQQQALAKADLSTFGDGELVISLLMEQLLTDDENCSLPLCANVVGFGKLVTCN